MWFRGWDDRIQAGRFFTFSNHAISHNVASGSDITPCIKIDKPLVHNNNKIITFFTPKMGFQSNLNVI